MDLNEILYGFVRAQQEFLCEQESGRAIPAKDGDILMSDSQTDNSLTVPVEDDFDASSDNIDRIKCIDGRWLHGDVEFPDGTKMLALSTAEVIQHWQDGLLVETIRQKPFPNVGELNAAIPQEQWSDGINGKRPPWSHQYAVSLLDPSDAAIYVCINSTVGQRIAVGRLSDKVKWMRQLRGARVVPLVLLDHRPMPTKHGAVKQRPEFTVVDWRELGGDGGGLEQKSVPQLGKPVKSVTSQEEMSDEIPF